jgi:hypothetical protein
MIIVVKTGRRIATPLSPPVAGLCRGADLSVVSGAVFAV